MGKTPSEEIPETIPGTRSYRTRVLSNLPVNGHFRLLTFDLPAEALPPKPGQFYMLSTGSDIEPLLKRPFCSFRKTDEGVQILYRIVGKGTRVLADTPGGAELDIVGPLGNSYPKPPKGLRPIVVTGGIGMASVYPLIEAAKGKCTVIYGARNANELMFTEELEALSSELMIATDDGSRGEKGTALDVLKNLSPGQGTCIYVCGPRPMIRAVKVFAAEQDIKGWASLEEYMACGIGACMGCVTPTTKGYSRVCKEGPIFKLSEIWP